MLLLLLVPQADVTVLPMTGIHSAYDLFVGLLVLLLGASKAIDVARTFGIIPEKVEGQGQAAAKNVGRLHVDSLKSIMNHQLKDALNPIAYQMLEGNRRREEAAAETNAKLEKIHLGIERMVTILEERKR